MRIRSRNVRLILAPAAGLTVVGLVLVWRAVAPGGGLAANGSASTTFEAPAGYLATIRHIMIDGHDAAVPPNGRPSRRPAVEALGAWPLRSLPSPDGFYAGHDQ